MDEIGKIRSWTRLLASFLAKCSQFFQYDRIFIIQYFSHQIQHLFGKFVNFLYWVLACSKKCEICFRFLSFISCLKANLVEFSCPQVGGQVYFIGSLVGRQAQSLQVQFRKINHGHTFENFILTSKVWVEIQGILRILAKWGQNGQVR